MPLGRGGESSDPDAVRRAAESLKAIEAGGLPLAAQERLANLRERGGSVYSSDLSTQEFLLIREAGFRPLSLVMGSCFYRMGYQAMPWSGYGQGGYGRGGWTPSYGQVFELETETEAWQEARRLAFSRLAEEARLAGADAVVGVRLERGERDWSPNVIEFVAVGTAVSSERYDLGDEPVLTNLSGQEFAKLYASDYWPVGIVANTTVLYVMTGWNQSMGSSRWAPNQELTDFTQGVQHARRTAVDRAARGAHAVQASGMVGVSLEVGQREHEREDASSNKFRDMIVTVHVLGTAIVEINSGREPPPVYTGLLMNQES
jgi:uncharacterized protein YbjQ (UPF0145 family)